VASDDRGWIAERHRVTVGSVALVVAALIATVVARNMFVAAHRILGWAVAASVVAVLVDPIVNRLCRHMNRIFALLLTLLAIGAIAGVLVYGVFANLQTEADHLKTEAPKAAAQIEARTDQLGQYARDFKLKERVDAFVASFEKHAGSGGQALRTAVGTVPTYFVCGILTIFLLIYGKRTVDGALAQISDKARRKRMSEVLADAVGRARGYIGGAIAEAVVFGLVAYAVCRVWGLPAPVVLGLVAGALALLPYIGFFLGAIPIALFAAGFKSITGAIVLVLVVIAIQAAEALTVRRWIDEKTMHVGPAIPVIVALLGYEIYGIGGAGYGVAIAVLLLALADASSTDDDIEIPTPLTPAEPSPATESNSSST
jgi:predicted PurR-regulated permease PerM